VEHFLSPTLGEGQSVVMDNLGAHRPERVRQLIEAMGRALGAASSQDVRGFFVH